MIPIEECKHGGLYRISSRNLALGVYNEQQMGFIGIREKFDCEYLFTEYHWDTGPPFGTVHPKEFLEMYPGNPVEMIERPATEEDLQWQISPKLKIGDPVRRENPDLRKWLEEKEDQYLGVDITIKELKERGKWEKACEVMSRDEDAGQLGSRSAISSDTTPIHFTRSEKWEIGIANEPE